MNAYKREISDRVIQISANILTMGAVALGMYHASRQPETMLAVFSQWFFPALAVVLLSAWLAARAAGRLWPLEHGETLNHLSVVDLPGMGPRLVRWSVLSSARPPAGNGN